MRDVFGTCERKNRLPLATRRLRGFAGGSLKAGLDLSWLEGRRRGSMAEGGPQDRRSSASFFFGSVSAEIDCRWRRTATGLSRAPTSQAQSLSGARGGGPRAFSLPQLAARRRVVNHSKTQHERWTPHARKNNSDPSVARGRLMWALVRKLIRMDLK